ncbi:EI24 domain-containing protein [Herminiimonas sp. CN]|uniref:EI24 domain-containing protein n=1 Tax=Herminiimonas sp. CN TaxID=1349818 RepID=UPI00047368D1|nr:EI24 domain-containing protein [Herminiimonas sp. CN]
MRPVLTAFGRALLSQLHYRMLLLTILPFLLSLVIWGVALWQGLQPLIDWLQEYFLANDGFRISGNVLALLGLGALKTVLVPLIAMWLLLPLMILTALLCIGLIAMPIIVRHVGQRHFPGLEARKGGSFWGSLWMSASSFLIFVLLWLMTLPLSLVPPLGLIVLTALWGWLTYRVMAYDALADYADAAERRAILRIHRWPLLVIGAASGALGAAPTLLWLGGALSVIFFPLLAAASIWLYVLVFVFTGLWFQYYCLAALQKYRAADIAGSQSPHIIPKSID